jgi:hypothetical protein
VVAGSAQADLTVYTDPGDWIVALTTPFSVIDWDDLWVTNASATAISGSRYSGMDGSPTLSADADSGLYIMNPGQNYYGEDFVAASDDNLFALDNADPVVGTLTISFGTPAYALGVCFIDVEEGYADTGIEVGGTFAAFDSNQGDRSESFLGIISSTPFTAADIHMAPGWTTDDMAIDDMGYALSPYVVPVPAAVLLATLGLGAAGLKLRKYV